MEHFADRSQEEEPNAQRSDRPIRTLKPHETVDYTWDWPVANKKRIRLVTDEVALPRGIDMMAIGIQPPIKIGNRVSNVLQILRKVLTSAVSSLRKQLDHHFP